MRFGRCFGGPDSMALLHVLNRLKGELRFKLLPRT
jgi:tRNA(Ile)-lysidine synthase TilS/MesJ